MSDKVSNQFQKPVFSPSNIQCSKPLSLHVNAFESALEKTELEDKLRPLILCRDDGPQEDTSFHPMTEDVNHEILQTEHISMLCS